MAQLNSDKLLTIPRYEVELCDVIWAIKDRAICHTFVDEGAATFFLPHLILERKEEEERMEGDVVKISSFKKTKYSQDGTVPGAQDGSSGSGEAVMASGEENVMVGVALGPDWHANLKMTGKHTNQVRLSLPSHISPSPSLPFLPVFPPPSPLPPPYP